VLPALEHMVAAASRQRATGTVQGEVECVVRRLPQSGTSQGKHCGVSELSAIV
jgi:hypothetical protein